MISDYYTQNFFNMCLHYLVVVGKLDISQETLMVPESLEEEISEKLLPWLRRPDLRKLRSSMRKMQQKIGDQRYYIFEELLEFYIVQFINARKSTREKFKDRFGEG